MTASALHFTIQKTFLSMLLISGDIQPNPGPIEPHSVCFRPVSGRNRLVQCANCSLWVHLSRSDLLDLSNVPIFLSKNSSSSSQTVSLKCHISLLLSPNHPLSPHTIFFPSFFFPPKTAYKSSNMECQWNSAVVRNLYNFFH